MPTVVAVSSLKDWPLDIPGVEVVLGRRYLTDPQWSRSRGLRVFNLCRSYQYQSTGYYVSLLAVARGHVPIPSLETILDMRSRVVVRAADEELEALIQKSLTPIQSERFVLSVYFGRNLARRYDRLALKLFGMFQAPFLRAQFARDEERWRLSGLAPIPAREVPPSHHDFVVEAATAYFDKPHMRPKPSRPPRYQLAILCNPQEHMPPSGEPALKRFERAAEDVGFGVERIDRDDYGRLAEFDALFLRETTYVNHHTFRFAQRAQAQGLAVIDDPRSILRCTNKVYLAERLALKGVPAPRTVVASPDTLGEVQAEVGFPCVLKHPDSAFSQGVMRCADSDELIERAQRIFEGSDLLVVQEFLPTGFDWRVGVFDRQPLYACRYFMAPGHWQIVKKTQNGTYRYGRTESVPLAEVPRAVVRTAVRAANLIGDGLYGVDLKQVGRRVYVIEVNDNPNLDVGYEDRELKDELFRRIMSGMMQRVERLKAARR